MKKTVLTEGEEGVQLIVKGRSGKREPVAPPRDTRRPVQVIYGGADRFTAETPKKLAAVAMATFDRYAPNFADFGRAMELPGSAELPERNAAEAFAKKAARNKSQAATERPEWFAVWSLFEKVKDKLLKETIEDIRIDFEDGYGSHSDDEEDADAVRTAKELAVLMADTTLPPFSGIRIRSLGDSKRRAIRTLDLFLDKLLESSGGKLPPNFAVTLPKITDRKQVSELASRLKKIEKRASLAVGSIGIELVIESPLVLFDSKGNCPLRSLVKAADGRCTSAHFGAYDYLASVGISGPDQSLDHPACDFARQFMIANFVPMGVPVSDSITTTLPIPIHRSGKLSKAKEAENARHIVAGWQKHFSNVSRSRANGFFQSWDLHPNQLPARYAAAFFDFVIHRNEMAKRLRNFVDQKARSVATLSTFDDAASVHGLVSFFLRGSECGAFSDKELKDSIGMSARELRALNF